VTFRIYIRINNRFKVSTRPLHPNRLKRWISRKPTLIRFFKAFRKTFHWTTWVERILSCYYNSKTRRPVKVSHLNLNSKQARDNLRKIMISLQSRMKNQREIRIELTLNSLSHRTNCLICRVLEANLIRVTKGRKMPNFSPNLWISNRRYYLTRISRTWFRIFKVTVEFRPTCQVFLTCSSINNPCFKECSRSHNCSSSRLLMGSSTSNSTKSSRECKKVKNRRMIANSCSNSYPQ
jgi:hypothetical protein